MKDYDHIILWLDYFNKTLTRRKGRRIKSERAVFDPTVADLVDAAKEAGYEPLPQETAEPEKIIRKIGLHCIAKIGRTKKIDCSGVRSGKNAAED